MNVPADMKYSSSHEWIKDNGDGTVTIGITDFAQSELGDVTFLELPEEGHVLTYDEPFGSVESIKAVSDLIAPVSGEVISVNTDLVDAAEAINSDPYEAWMVVVRLSDPSEMASLMGPQEYTAFTEG